MAVDSKLVYYSSIPTSTIPIATGQTLETILQNIDAAINAHNTAPNYSGYNLYCVKQVDGTTHPTNTQNFAEGISKNLCDFHTAYNTFTGTTYPAAIATLTSGINNVQSPGLTYSPFSIVNTDTNTQVWNKSFTGFTTITAAQNPSSGNWATLSISPPTTITTGFNSLIAYIVGMNTTIAGKQATIATINNSGNCLATIGGTSTDTILTTVGLLTTLACSLPTFASGSITWGGVTTGSGLQATVQNTINAVSTLMTNAVNTAGTGLTIAAVGSTYQGKKLAVDLTYTPIYKTMVNSADTTPDYLYAKLAAGTGITLAIQNVAADENVLITNSLPETYQVKVNTSDTTPMYLASKLPSTADPSWGLSLYANPSSNNSQLNLTPTLGNPVLFAENFMNYISTNPTLLLQFEQLVQQANTNPGTPISNLVVALSSATLVLTWTHQTGGSQIAKFRQFSTATWFTSGFSVPNPLSGTAVTDTLSAPTANIVYDFQVDTIYTGGTAGSNIFQGIYYLQQTVTNTVTGGVIAVNQNPLMLDTIQYRLKLSSTVLQNISTTGASPAVAFTSVASGTYTVEWRYGSLVNGSTLYSDDSTQHGSWWGTGSIVVP